MILQQSEDEDVQTFQRKRKQTIISDDEECKFCYFDSFEKIGGPSTTKK